MSLNSVNTNVGAMIALQSLNKTNEGLATAQKQVSTGYRVADATDDGAAFAVAQSVRSTVGALTSANQQLGNVQGLLNTTQSGLTDIQNKMASMRDVLVKLSDGNTQGNDRTNYIQQYNSYLANVQTFIQDAAYNGKTLIGNLAGTTAASAGLRSPVTKQDHPTASRPTADLRLYKSDRFTGTILKSATSVATLITATGTFINQMNAVGKALNTDRRLDQLRGQPDQLQQRQDRRVKFRSWLAGGR